MTEWIQFGKDRHRPPGEWVQATQLCEVAGVGHRRRQSTDFAQAVRKAELKGWLYGLRLEPDPSNHYDPNAIKVIGYAEKRRLVGGRTRSEWFIGFVPKDEARIISGELVAKGIPIAGELYRIFTNADYVGFDMFVLAPKGHSLSARSHKGSS